MADAIRKYSNLHLINAPAGSGKTTRIRKQISEHLKDKPKEHILCITYTNRAANELKSELNYDNVYIGTIHSYLNDLMSGFYDHKKIIELFFEMFHDEIVQKINDKADKNESNKRYIERYGALDLDTVFKNLKISYGEGQYTSVYYGKLGHDDLIRFTQKAVEKFPVLKRKISSKYKLIFIDEYQDTSADVLRIFYSAVKDSNSELYLLGDKMQQIYSNYDGSFEEEFKNFDIDYRWKTNYRAVPQIVNVLNNIYNDANYMQKAVKKTSSEEKPRVIFTDYKKIDEVLDQLKVQFPNSLVLYPTNKQRFDEIGAENLFKGFSDLYPYGGNIDATALLINDDEHSRDELLKFLFMIADIYEKFLDGNFGYIINLLKDSLYKLIINANNSRLHCHQDKKKVKNSLEAVLKLYVDEEITIKDFIDRVMENKFINSDWYDSIFENNKYDKIVNVKLGEFRKLVKYLVHPNVSTQYGVKGEGHDSVIFVAKDNSKLNLQMTNFFKLWCNVGVNMAELEEFMYQYEKKVTEIEKLLGVKIDKAKKEHFDDKKDDIINCVNEFAKIFQTNQYYTYILKDKISEFLRNSNLSNLRKYVKKNEVRGIVNAYRLFYVGCSRAKEKLVVIIQKEVAEETGNKLYNKMKTCGFEVDEWNK